MNKQARVWIVVTCLLASVGLVYTMSVQPSPQAGAAPRHAIRLAPENTAHAEQPQNPAVVKQSTPKINAYSYLRPTPVGKAAPDFKALGADGKTVHLAGYKGKKNLVLIFYQGSFCQLCAAQLTNLQQHLADFKAQDAEIIAISADDKAHAMQSVGEHGLTFPVVPDRTKTIIDQYGVANIGKDGIAWPAAFIVDKKGIVQLSFASKDGHRLHSNELLPVLARMTGKPAPANLTYDH